MPQISSTVKNAGQSLRTKVSSMRDPERARTTSCDTSLNPNCILRLRFVNISFTSIFICEKCKEEKKNAERKRILKKGVIEECWICIFMKTEENWRVEIRDGQGQWDKVKNTNFLAYNIENSTSPEELETRSQEPHLSALHMRRVVLKLGVSEDQSMCAIPSP